MLLTAGSATAQSSIELRASAKLMPGAAVTLGQIARLEGPDALALGGVVIKDADHAQPGPVTVEEVEQALNATGRINWGRLTMRGSVCTLTEPVAAKMAAAATNKPVEVGPSASAPVAAGTVREAVVARIAQMLQSEPEDLRVTFTASDDGFLAMPIAGRTVEVRATAEADRMPLQVTVFEGDRIVGEPKTIRVAVQIRRSVVTSVKAVRRGESFGRDDVQAEERWLGPTAKPAPMDRIVGAVAKSRLSPGSVITLDDLGSAAVVSKGDVVVIRCVSGSVALTTRGRALTEGLDGEVVEFQALDSKRIFRARMDGRGRAVISTGGEFPRGAEVSRNSDSVQRGLEAMR